MLSANVSLRFSRLHEPSRTCKFIKVSRAFSIDGWSATAIVDGLGIVGDETMARLALNDSGALLRVMPVELGLVGKGILAGSKAGISSKPSPYQSSSVEDLDAGTGQPWSEMGDVGELGKMLPLSSKRGGH